MQTSALRLPARRSRLQGLDGLGMRAEQRQQQRDFFLRTDLDHGCLLFAPLVGANGRGVQDDLVSAMFQACFVATWLPPGRACLRPFAAPCRPEIAYTIDSI